MGAQFSRVRPSKNRSGGRLRTASARKIDKNRFRLPLRTYFLGPGLVFCRFWGPGRVPKSSQNRSRGWDFSIFWQSEIVFLFFLCSGAFREDPGAIPEAPGSLPDQILHRFCDTFLPASPGSGRGLSGSAGMLPGCTASLRNSLCGVPLGYGDLAQRFK